MIHACYGMHCPYEDFRGECSWKKGWPFPCDMEEGEVEDLAEEEEYQREMRDDARREARLFG